MSHVVTLIASRDLPDLAGLAAHTADALIVIGRGRLLAQTTVAELSATGSSLEEAFFRLTEGSTEYNATYEPIDGINYPLRSVS